MKIGNYKNIKPTLILSFSIFFNENTYSCCGCLKNKPSKNSSNAIQLIDKSDKNIDKTDENIDITNICNQKNVGNLINNIINSNNLDNNDISSNNYIQNDSDDTQNNKILNISNKENNTKTTKKNEEESKNNENISKLKNNEILTVNDKNLENENINLNNNNSKVNKESNLYGELNEDNQNKYLNKVDLNINTSSNTINTNLNDENKKSNDTYNELNINNTGKDLKNTNLVIKNIDINNITIKEDNTNDIYKNNDNINNFDNTINSKNNIGNINNSPNSFQHFYPQGNNYFQNQYPNITNYQFNNNLINPQIQLPMNISEPQENKTYNIRGNIGLNNVGATCFMNSTLQCLSHTEELTKYFLNPKNKERIIKNNIALKDPNALQLSLLYLELITKLWAKDGSKNYSPYNFMNGIQSMNPLFQKGQAGDAKDFIIYVLEQLHSELKKNMNIKKVELEPLNQYDRNNAMQHFFSEFQEELSIISDLFFGFNETTNICLDCKNEYSSKGQAFPICYNYGIFNCIIFPLEEVKIMKNKFMQIYNLQDNRGLNAMNNNRVSLIECFIYNQKTDKFTKNNQNYCNICRKLADSNYTSKIYISPNILILILNRGKGNKFDVKLDFAEIIDISDFVIFKEKPKITYNLFGVVTHLGESGPYAHFIASCKSHIDNAWYRFNDGLVYPIKDFQKEVHDYGNPYILFYQKNKN